MKVTLDTREPLKMDLSIRSLWDRIQLCWVILTGDEVHFYNWAIPKKKRGRPRKETL